MDNERYLRYMEYLKKYDEKLFIKLKKKEEKINSLIELSNQAKTNKEIATILNISHASIMQLKRYARDNGVIFKIVQLGRPIRSKKYCPTCNQIIK